MSLHLQLLSPLPLPFLLKCFAYGHSKMPYQPTYPPDHYTVGMTTFNSNTERRAPPEYEIIEMNELARVDTQSSRPTTQEPRRRPLDLQVGVRTGRNELPEPATQPNNPQPDAQPARRWLPTFGWSEREDGTETLEDARESILISASKPSER
jgi:hypothetical protein